MAKPDLKGPLYSSLIEQTDPGTKLPCLENPIISNRKGKC